MPARRPWAAPPIAVMLAALVAWTPSAARPAAAAELYRPGQGSLYADPVASRVGDVVIVHLDSTSLQVSAGGQSSTTSNSSIISLISQQGLQSSNNSTTAWQHALSGDLSTRVVEITPEGLMHVRGVRRIQVDKTWQKVTIDGFMRPQDLAADDTIQGSRLADVQATVEGHLTTAQRFGLLDALALLFGVGTLLKFLP